MAITAGNGGASNGAGGAVTIAPGTPNGTGATANVTVTGIRTVSTSAAAITTTRILELSDSGGCFSAAQSSAYQITVPTPPATGGLRYRIYLTSPGSFDVTIVSSIGAGAFVGILQNDVTGTVPATGATFTFKSGVSLLGDFVELVAVSASLYHCFAICQANGGITIT